MELEYNFRGHKLSAIIFHNQQIHRISTLYHNCSQYRDDLTEAYLKTKFIFGNGLMLNKQSLIGTKYDDFDEFKMHLHTLIQTEKQDFSELAQGNETSDNKLSDVSDLPLAQLGPSVVSLRELTHHLYAIEWSEQRKLMNNVLINGIPYT